MDDNFATLDSISIPEYQMPSPDDNKHKFNEKKEEPQMQKENKLVAWNPNKHRKNINIRKNENGTSN